MGEPRAGPGAGRMHRYRPGGRPPDGGTPDRHHAAGRLGGHSVSRATTPHVDLVSSPSQTTTIIVHVQPRAKKTEIVGWHGDALKIRVSSPPVEGAAIAELVRYLADRLNLSKVAVRIQSGLSARRKRISIDGLSREVALARLTDR